MTLTTMIQSQRWEHLSHALDSTEPYISALGGRYLSDHRFEAIGGFVDDYYLNHLYMEIYNSLRERVLLPPTNTTDLSDAQRQAVLSVINKLVAFDERLNSQLPNVSYFAFYSTHVFDFFDRIPLSQNDLFPFGIHSIQSMISPMLENEGYAQTVRLMFAPKRYAPVQYPYD